MELELCQLDLRYAALRTRDAVRERRLLASLALAGQQMPIIVVRDADRFVVVDGYKRVQALGRLGQDTVVATEWALSEAEALLLERVLRAGEADSAIEQGWFLREMSERFALSLGELARRLDRTKSWVSRRIALVAELPASVQEQVRAGAIGAHAAAKYLVPLARANAADCERLCEAVAPERPTSRQLALLYAAYRSGGARARELVVNAPAVVLRAQEEAGRQALADATPLERLLSEVRIVAAVARRACGRLRRGALDASTDPERARVRAACTEACAEVESLWRYCQREAGDARPEHAHGDPASS